MATVPTENGIIGITRSTGGTGYWQWSAKLKLPAAARTESGAIGGGPATVNTKHGNAPLPFILHGSIK